MPLQAIPITPRDIQPDDLICFDYDNPHDHPPGRVGYVENFAGSIERDNLCVVLWDFSLFDGPSYRNYRITGLRHLQRISSGTPKEPVLEVYKKNLKKFPPKKS